MVNSKLLLAFSELLLAISELLLVLEDVRNFGNIELLLATANPERKFSKLIYYYMYSYTEGT